MKTLFVTITLLTLGILSANAQEIATNAAGIRVSHSDGLPGIELSYQRKFFEKNRAELNLGLRGNSGYSYFKLTGLYQWVNHLDGDFNWYFGAGGGFGNSANLGNSISNTNSNTFVFASGVVGIEYKFDFPLLVSFDFRPELGFNDDFYRGFNPDFGLSARYTF